MVVLVDAESERLAEVEADVDDSFVCCCVDVVLESLVVPDAVETTFVLPLSVVEVDVEVSDFELLAEAESCTDVEVDSLVEVLSLIEVDG
ncbi:hypothetical protein IV38_GL001896 [Lactobacillus selangorensis]|uniref:Uncharacterized protein n=1 Tax=Lactobacillus selangorensis TaxID=81857 RepID=A0A0R2FSP7_9LACO|nr:hypothetical protein IV38_GL001896 [Lactobacillus selangorensis]